LPAPRLKVVSTFPGPVHPWLAFGEEVLDAEVVHAIAPRAALTIVLVKGTSLDSAGQAVAASVAALRLGASQGGVISLSPAGETAWGLPDGSPGSPFQASGGGFSHLFHRPSYQNGVQSIGTMRGIPDVAADGDSVTGIAVITSNAGGGYTLSGHAGTSASAPL